MKAITVVSDTGRTVIRRRQNGVTWLLCIPHLSLLCFEVAIPVAAILRVLADVKMHHPLHALVVVGGVLFGLKAWWFGRFLYRTLAAQSLLVIQGDTLQVKCGQFGNLDDLGTYSSIVLSELSLQSGKNLVLPAGRVQAQVAGVPITIADCISDSDGSHLIDVLCDAYPFSTPEDTPSPAVVRWR